MSFNLVSFGAFQKSSTKDSFLANLTEAFRDQQFKSEYFDIDHPEKVFKLFCNKQSPNCPLDVIFDSTCPRYKVIAWQNYLKLNYSRHRFYFHDLKKNEDFKRITKTILTRKKETLPNNNRRKKQTKPHKQYRVQYKPAA